MQRPKQRSKYSLAPVRDFRSKIKDIMDAVACNRHGVPVGVPCFHLPRDTGGFYAALCNRRIQEVYNGRIDPTSISTKRPKKEFTR